MSQANLLEALGWAVLNSLWQLALLWVLFQIFTSAFRLTSRTKGSLAAILLVAGFGWFIYTFFEAWVSVPSAGLSAALADSTGIYEVNVWLSRALPAASIIYLVLLLGPVLHFIKNYRYVQVIRTYGLTKMNVEWRMFVKRISSNIDLKRKVSVWVSDLVSSPVTIGFIKPVILIPIAALNNLTTQQLEAILLHELSHIKRDDYLVNLIINVIKTILYFNPFVKAFVKIVEREREKSCDEMVLQFQYDSHEYASALLLLEKTGLQQPLQLRATGRKSDLLHRVEMIMGVRNKKSFTFNNLAGFLSGLLCIIGLNALVLLNNPLKAEKNFSFSRVSASFTFFTGNFHNTDPQYEVQLSENPTLIRTRQHDSEKETVMVSAPVEQTPPHFPNASSYITANYEAASVHHLKSYQEEQVKVAMESSKKVLESIQWDMIEQSIADAFNQKEKEEIKNVYEKEINRINWKEWENSLRAAYSQIDWDVVNSKLDKAVTEVRIDSIQKVYNLALTKLDKVKRELKSHEMKGIPDSDITLHEIEKTRVETVKAINTIRAIRNKRIVHL